MTQEEKEPLLKDLAARVPYNIMVEQTLFPPPLADKKQRLKSVQANNVVQLYWYKYINEFVPIHCIKPYLRPMSSMTEEEYDEWCSLVIPTNIKNKDGLAAAVLVVDLHEAFRFLNAHHFDYNGLIEKGLALEAPEGMYNIKEK